VSPAALALAWVLAQPDVSPIVGVSSPAQLDTVAQALALDLTPDDAVVLADALGP
jgi:aryl-alcohol dehydrogenase-like predicted oxidoreductase